MAQCGQKRTRRRGSIFTEFLLSSFMDDPTLPIQEWRTAVWSSMQQEWRRRRRRRWCKAELLRRAKLQYSDHHHQRIQLSVFLQTGCHSCRRSNGVKALTDLPRGKKKFVDLCSHFKTIQSFYTHTHTHTQTEIVNQVPAVGIRRRSLKTNVLNMLVCLRGCMNGD